MNVYYINLDRSQDRNLFLQKQLKEEVIKTIKPIVGKQLIDIFKEQQTLTNQKERKILEKEEHGFYRVSAIDGRVIQPSTIQALIQQKLLQRPTLPRWKLKNTGRLGTYLTHIGLWAHIYQHCSDDYVLILEDDVILPEKIVEASHLLVEKVEKNNLNWDILFIGHAGKLRGQVVIPNLLMKPDIGVWPDTNHGMFAYLLKVSSIPTLMNIMLPIPKPPQFAHVDNHLRTFYQYTKCYYTLVNIVPHVDAIVSVREQTDNGY